MCLDFVVITPQIKTDKHSASELLKSAALAVNGLDISQDTRWEKLPGKKISVGKIKDSFCRLCWHSGMAAR